MVSDNSGLYEPLSDPQGAVVDVVFVHGLNGNRERTWSNKYHFWPKTLLPASLPKARIFTWGYDSKLAHFWTSESQSRIDDHSTKLLHDLANVRATTDSLDRPIIFVAHSMGGLVCANALVIRQNSPEKQIKSTVAAVRGLMFLGTPHAGSDKVKWANTGQKFLKFVANVNRDVTEILEKDSVKLAQLGQFFPEFLRQRGEQKNSKGGESKIEVACFFEEHKTKPIGYVVEKESAKLAGYPLIGILADHTDMCRFAGEKDPGYVSVSGTLIRWVAEITSPKDQQGGHINLVQYGSTFQGGNYGGLNIGNANSFGGGSAVNGSHPIFGNQEFHFGRQE